MIIRFLSVEALHVSAELANSAIIDPGPHYWKSMAYSFSLQFITRRRDRPGSVAATIADHGTEVRRLAVCVGSDEGGWGWVGGEVTKLAVCIGSDVVEVTVKAGGGISVQTRGG